jgi:hypothetical protein
MRCLGRWGDRACEIVRTAFVQVALGSGRDGVVRLTRFFGEGEGGRVL